MVLTGLHDRPFSLVPFKLFHLFSDPTRAPPPPSFNSFLRKRAPRPVPIRGGVALSERLIFARAWQFRALLSFNDGVFHGPSSTDSRPFHPHEAPLAATVMGWGKTPHFCGALPKRHGDADKVVCCVYAWLVRKFFSFQLLAVNRSGTESNAFKLTGTIEQGRARPLQS